MAVTWASFLATVDLQPANEDTIVKATAVLVKAEVPDPSCADGCVYA